MGAGGYLFEFEEEEKDLLLYLLDSLFC